MLCTGVHNIRDVIAFPRTPNNAEFWLYIVYKSSGNTYVFDAYLRHSYLLWFLAFLKILVNASITFDLGLLTKNDFATVWQGSYGVVLLQLFEVIRWLLFKIVLPFISLEELVLRHRVIHGFEGFWFLWVRPDVLLVESIEPNNIIAIYGLVFGKQLILDETVASNVSW